MKKISISTLGIVLVLILSQNACKKINLIDNNPQLEITVLDANGVKVQGASVVLFLSEEEWENQINPLISTNSDALGIALFEDLDESIYYFYVEKGNLNNRESIAVIDHELESNVRAHITTIIK